MFGSISVLHVPVIGTIRGVGPSAWDGGGVEGFRGGGAGLGVEDQQQVGAERRMVRWRGVTDRKLEGCQGAT